MPQYPGVHIFENTRLSLATSGVSEPVPVLIAEFDPAVGTVVPVENWLGFTEIFGESESGLALTVRSYFNNGGSRFLLANTSGRNVEEVLAEFGEGHVVTVLEPGDQGTEPAGE
ncbi:hypothetical protein ACIRQY_34045 [Streptomyces sp. NPDC101490]|uniref:hypothetical protein n=1 Tax=Streptomyces sp. NPDC101490 TaxID=3366143 RepID=UPI0037F4E646